MKQRHYISLAFAATLGMMVVGCTEEVYTPRIPIPSDVEIVPMATVAGTRGSLSGVQDGPQFPSSTDGVFAVSAFLTSDAYDKKYSGGKVLNDSNANANMPYFLNQPIRTDENGNFHFNTENGSRYYPEDGSHVYFHAFSPANAIQDTTDYKKVSWTLTGQEDIMYARDLRGIRKAHGSDFDSISQPQPEFKFEHLMTRLDFKLARGNGYGERLKVYSLEIFDFEDKASLDLSFGSLTFDYNDDSKHDLLIEKEMLNVAILEAIPYITVMSSPRESIKFKVNSMGIDYPPLTIKAETSLPGAPKLFEAGKRYEIILNFTGIGVNISASLVKWQDGGSSNETVIMQ